MKMLKYKTTKNETSRNYSKEQQNKSASKKKEHELDVKVEISNKVCNKFLGSSKSCVKGLQKHDKSTKGSIKYLQRKGQSNKEENKT